MGCDDRPEEDGVHAQRNQDGECRCQVGENAGSFWTAARSFCVATRTFFAHRPGKKEEEPSNPKKRNRPPAFCAELLRIGNPIHSLLPWKPNSRRRPWTWAARPPAPYPGPRRTCRGGFYVKDPGGSSRRILRHGDHESFGVCGCGTWLPTASSSRMGNTQCPPTRKCPRTFFLSFSTHSQL